jgi:hypothetical protein
MINPANLSKTSIDMSKSFLITAHPSRKADRHSITRLTTKTISRDKYSLQRACEVGLKRAQQSDTYPLSKCPHSGDINTAHLHLTCEAVGDLKVRQSSLTNGVGLCISSKSGCLSLCFRSNPCRFRSRFGRCYNIVGICICLRLYPSLRSRPGKVSNVRTFRA